MPGPRAVVNGPSFTPSPYGLWSVAQKPTATDPHWQNGITWTDRCPQGDTLYDECIAVTGTGGITAGQASKAATFTQSYRGATPFAIYVEFDCSGVGVGDVMKIADDAMARTEQYLIEKAFWTGVAGKTQSGGAAQTTVFPHLAANATLVENSSNGAITLQTAATQIVTGGGDIAHNLGNLEAQLADCYHGQGVIHVPVEAFDTLAAWNLLEITGDAVYTKRGNRVVVGDGYTGSSPSGAAAADQTSWIYATGAVFGYRAEVPVIRNATEGFDRVENTYKMIAERVYVIGFECCHLATMINLGVPT